MQSYSSASKCTTEDLLGFKIAVEDVHYFADSIILLLESKYPFKWLACFNPHSFAISLNEKYFLKALAQADWLTPDGVGVVLASRILKGGIRNRLTGSELFRAVMERLDLAGGRSVFFLGANAKTLETIRERVGRDFPHVRVAGTYAPAYRAESSEAEDDAMVAAVNAARADVLWVGMTAPKQEKWIWRNRERLNVRFAAAIGAVFDFYSGRVRRPPVLIQKMGLEWLARLIQEPRRLWRRTFESAPIFLFYVLKGAGCRWQGAGKGRGPRAEK